MRITLFCLAALLMSAATFAQTTTDETAVRTVIETETKAYLSANPTLTLAQWSDKPYVERQHASLVPMLKAPYLKGPTLKPMMFRLVLGLAFFYHYNQATREATAH